MKGGAREQLLDLVKKYTQPLEFYFGVMIVLGIVYVGQIPDSISYQANTFFGRLFLFCITIFIADLYSWVYALLMALFTVLLIAVSPRTFSGWKEGFQNTSTEIKLVGQKNKWWVERLLQENPLGIEEEKVKTNAIQDNTNSSNSFSSSR
jgi:hypothetical protein